MNKKILSGLTAPLILALVGFFGCGGEQQQQRGIEVYPSKPKVTPKITVTTEYEKPSSPIVATEQGAGGGSCQTDAECGVVPIDAHDCFPCANGKGQLAIAKSAARQHMGPAKDKCKPLHDALRAGKGQAPKRSTEQDHQSCKFNGAKCVQGTCQLANVEQGGQGHQGGQPNQPNLGQSGPGGAGGGFNNTLPNSPASFHNAPSFNQAGSPFGNAAFGANSPYANSSFGNASSSLYGANSQYGAALSGVSGQQSRWAGSQPSWGSQQPAWGAGAGAAGQASWNSQQPWAGGQSSWNSQQPGFGSQWGRSDWANGAANARSPFGAGSPFGNQFNASNPLSRSGAGFPGFGNGANFPGAFGNANGQGAWGGGSHYPGFGMQGFPSGSNVGNGQGYSGYNFGGQR